MPRTALTADTRYTALVRGLRAELQKTRAAIEHRLVLTYWNVGKAMDAYLSRHAGSVTLAALTRRLSGDLNIHVRTLQHCNQFFRAYPRLTLSRPISWSHYRILLTLDSPARRAQWERRILHEGLSQKELLALLNEKREGQGRFPDAGLPEPQRGLLYHYRLIRVGYANATPGGIMVDCGFETRIVPPLFNGTLATKRIVVSLKDERGYRIRAVNVTQEVLYTYKACVERVIDGDTVLANVDCGFGIWTRQKLRLRGIDAPERNTVKGLRAKRWVETELGPCPFVVIRTSRSDKYDRYLADIFYDPQSLDPARVAESGAFLNGRLLQEGLAGLYAP